MTVPECGRVTILEPVERVVADYIEHPEPRLGAQGLFAAEQAVVEQRGKGREVCIADSFGRGESAASSEHTE